MDGLAEALDNLEIQYTYHEHEGSEGPTSNGCYFYPVYHEHETSCYCPGPSRFAGPVYLQNANGSYTRYSFICNNCGKENGYNHNNPYGSSANFCVAGSVLCGKTPGGTIESYILGCGKDETTVESVTIIY